MLTNILIWGILLFTIAVCLWQSLNETRFKKNLCLGVTLPFEAHDDPQLIESLHRYKRRQKLAAAVLAVLCIAGMFISELSISLVLWSPLFLAVITLPTILEVLTNRELKQLKATRGWNTQQRNVVRVDVSNIPDCKPVSFKSYLFPLLLCTVSALFSFDLWPAHLSMVALVLLSFCGSRFLFRNKSETVDDDPALAKALTELRRKRWNWVWLLSAYCAAGFSVLAALFPHFPTLSTILGIVICIAVAILAFFLDFQTRHLQEKLTAESGKGWYLDEDDYWLGGILYYNPNDSHILINSRTGMNSTINLATKTGKVCMIVTVLLVLLAPVNMVMTAAEDIRPIQLAISGQSVQCESGFTSYTVPLDEIKELTLLEELPSSLFRVSGFGGQHTLKGSFSSEGLPGLKVLVDPLTPPYIQIKTNQDTSYLLSARDPAVTHSIFEQMLAASAK